MGRCAVDLFMKLITNAISRGASDIHIKSDGRPYFRVDGELVPRKRLLTRADVAAILDFLLSPVQKQYFEEHGEVDLSFERDDVGRFRVNVFMQRGRVSIVMRRIQAVIPSFDELVLPQVVEELARMQRGLVLVTGTTGSGKSTSLAAIIDHINRHRRCHIVSIEDPIEFTHKDRMSVINQREINIDTDNFSSALKAVMRQDPDVILIGEMRDIETFQAAISAAETGHLVFSTLHTSNVMMTIDRIIDLFPSNQHDQVRSQLSLNLKAIMCQRLLPMAGGEGRVPACEVAIVSPGIQMLIKENRINRIPVAIQQGREDGMQTFNDSIFALLNADLISEETALAVSENPEELKLRLQGIELGQMRGGLLGNFARRKPDQ
jgi:twitching motility protein PilT